MKRNFIAAVLTITATAAILATASCTRSSIVIESPESMGCINMSWGNLEATKVIIADTATTVCFRMKYRTDKTFCFVSNSYLRDEVGNRYPLRSAVGIKLDDIISMPDSVFEFTMNFEPLPRKVQVFDFIEGDVDRAFMLLGIHDKKIERNVPTFKQLSAKNRFTVPDDWFKTDTITIRGRIEGYDAEKFGFSSMECYLDDVFAKNIATTIVLDIAADGSFEKRFVASSPIVQNFVASYSKLNFYYLNFFACPGETIDITVKPDESGGYECFYNTGNSKEVERFLKTEAEINVGYIINELYAFNGCFDDAMIIAEKTKQNLALQLAAMDHSNHFSPLEMQLALAEKQINYVFALTTYLHNREQALLRNEKIELDNGNTYYSTIITDSVEYEKLLDVENYSQMHCIDFDNPLLMTNRLFLLAVSRLQILKPVERLIY